MRSWPALMQLGRMTIPADRLDLAVVTFDLSSSGVNRNALRIAAAAQAAGMAVEIWSAQDFGELRDEVPAGVPLRSLGAELGGGYTRRARRKAIATVTDTLCDMITARRPRVTLSSGNHVHPFAVDAFTARSRPGDMELVGRVSNALRPLNLSLWKLPGKVRKRLIARKRYQSMHRLIAVTEEIKRDLVRKMGVDERRIVVIPNGIDLAKVSELGRASVTHPWFEVGEPPVVLGVGRLAPQKNFELLLRAFALARTAMPMRLMILGDGPSRQREQLEAVARKLSILDQVHFAGHVPNPFPYYRAASLFVLSSSWEGMSNVLLEALASGCPIVSTDCLGGSTEILANGRFGTVVPVDEPTLLANAIVDRLTQPRNSALLLKRAADFDLRDTMQHYVSMLQAAGQTA